MSEISDALDSIESYPIRVTLTLLNLVVQTAKVYIILHFIVKFW